jgi:DNA-binding SARP family transcriptional activator/tetratricopeptide (TPR) repeat protein
MGRDLIVHVTVRLLDDFAVLVAGTPVPASRWSHRNAAALVKLLALSPGGKLHRDRVVDTLWPDLTLDVALPRLHKAAHYARAALGDRDAVVLKGEVVALFPAATLEVDAITFEAVADAALAANPASPEGIAGALKIAGELLPEDLGEPWLEEPRERLRHRVAQLLRCARRWEDLLRIDPANEEAHVELLREAVVVGDRTTALRRYARMERALESELGISPGPEAVVLRERLLTSATGSPQRKDGGRSVADSSPVQEGTGRASAGQVQLVERDAELEELTAAVSSAVEESRGVVVLVSGEAGAGKTALVRAFLDRLDPGITVALGGCDDLLAPRSLGPFRDMAENSPELAVALSGTGLDDALPALLHVFAERPSVVVVEDVHWADDATLDAIRFLARRFPGIPGTLVLTFRETGADAGHPLRQLLGSLAGSSVRRVTLPPLSVAAVRRLGAGSAAQAVEIQRVTQGNPFFVTEVLAAGGVGVPHTVRDAVLARLGRLPPPVRTLVERLSVIPTRAERPLAETLAAGDPWILVEAERSGMILGGDATISFRHELARQAIESSLTAGERIQANRMVVDALLEEPEVEASRLVHHAERAGRIDVILAHGPAAAIEAARLGAHRQAAEVLGVVLEHRAHLDSRQIADLFTRRAYSLYVVNRFGAALQCAESGVRAAEDAGDPILHADALLVLARVALFACGPLRARWAAAQAVDLLESVGDDARLAAALTESARVHGNLPTIGIVAEPSERAEVFAKRAVSIAQRLQRKDIEAQARCYLGDARLARGDRRGAADLRRAITLAGSDSRLETRVRCYVNAAGGAYRSGQLDDADRYVAAGLRAAADGEFFAGQYRLRLTGAAVQASRGDWDRAIAGLRELLDSPGEPGAMAAFARSLLARLLARRGDVEAGVVLAGAFADGAVENDSFVAGSLAVAQVELGWLDGSLGALTDAAKRALELTEAVGHRSVQAELCAYLRRAGIEAPDLGEAPGPWAPTLAGRWQEAATAWAALGERYEQAVVLATAPDRQARSQGLARLGELGAVAVVPAV